LRRAGLLARQVRAAVNSPARPTDTFASARGAHHGRPGIFLDRDGTLILDRGDLGNPSDVELLPGVVELLRELQARFSLFIVTNQSAVAAGRLTLQQVERVNAAVVERLRVAGVVIERVFVCPHARADGCDCIKPKPHFLRVAELEHGIDLGRSFTVGDHPHDAELATSVGATGIYVLTGHGLKHLGELGAGFVVVPSLADARPALLEACADGPAGEIARAAGKLRRGQIVAFPTETVYGLGANALDPKAVARIFDIKRRPAFDPLIVHIDRLSWVERIALDVPPAATTLMQAFWPGPLTVVLPKAPIIPDLVTAGLPTVALRMPAHEAALSLIRTAGVPVCAPSANPFGYVSPTRAEHVIEQLGEAVECVVDGGPCAVGIESTIVDLSATAPRILRVGAISAEDLSSALGQELAEQAAAGPSPTAPGMLPRHYSPHVRVRLFDGEIPLPPAASCALVLQRPRAVPAGYAVVETLSQTGDLAEVAQNLFASLRRLDKEAVDLVVAEIAPERGIGRAINDRLRRASFR
jgi:L-threonylcarbamoyladenylate synthase